VDVISDWKGREDAIAALFERTFTASEGEAEGRLVGALARDILATTPASELFLFAVEADGAPVACILFTRLVFSGDDRSVFLLSPVAVAPEQQGSGLGTGLIAHGLASLRTQGVAVAMTYGDPGFYGRLGFLHVAETDVPAPFPLAHPEGWLAQSLDGGPVGVIRGRSRCVPALARPEVW